MEVYERELANRKMIVLIKDSLRDVTETDKKIDGAIFLNEMKTKYGKQASDMTISPTGSGDELLVHRDKTDEPGGCVKSD